jgi:hypothetical protein
MSRTISFGVGLAARSVAMGYFERRKPSTYETASVSSRRIRS